MWRCFATLLLFAIWVAVEIGRGDVLKIGILQRLSIHTYMQFILRFTHLPPKIVPGSLSQNLLADKLGKYSGHGEMRQNLWLRDVFLVRPAQCSECYLRKRVGIPILM